ncbi:hypothetical protein N9N28_05010 [Rubripirellula amarantea]|nr:hypothetical protein [Rubripirellula amarantea]
MNSLKAYIRYISDLFARDIDEQPRQIKKLIQVFEFEREPFNTVMTQIGGAR